MSRSNRIANVGASARASDVQKISDVAALADDAAMEYILTPGSVQKRILAMLIESQSVPGRLLVVGKDTDGTVPNAQVGVLASHFLAGVSGDTQSIGLGSKLNAKAFSPSFANNSSGSTRYDLLYAAISYGNPTTAAVRQKPTAGSSPQTVTLTIQNDMVVTIGIIANVASGNPLASLPADTGSGKAAVYNFGLAMVAIANGFAGGAVNQSTITPLWGSALIGHHRVRGYKPMSLYYGGASEKPGGSMQSQVQGAERWGVQQKFFAHLKFLTTTPDIASNAGTIIDSSIDWRHRILFIDIAYLGSAATAIESQTNPVTAYPTTSPVTCGRFVYAPNGGGFSSGSLPQLGYVASGGIIIQVDTSGNLRICRNSGHAAPIDAANGDLIAITVEATDQFLSNPY